LLSTIQGDLGRSIKDSTPVSKLIGEKLPTTIELAVFAMAIAIGIGVPAGLLAATNRGSGWMVS
jgi:peptide/nickel transport system permease protein